jgi:hypothetical protein
MRKLSPGTLVHVPGPMFNVSAVRQRQIKALGKIIRFYQANGGQAAEVLVMDGQTGKTSLSCFLLKHIKRAKLYHPAHIPGQFTDTTYAEQIMSAFNIKEDQLLEYVEG